MKRLLRLIPWLALLTAAVACGSRNQYWDTSTGNTASYGLANGVALVDDADHRVVMLTAGDNQEVTTHTFSIGHNVTTTATSPDGMRLFVLSTGDWPRLTVKDEYPSLTVIDASTFDITALPPYKMTEPLSNLAIDPLGHWAVAYAGATSSKSFVQNANEFIVFDLTMPGSTPTPRSIRSMGGTPQRLTFTPVMQLPKGPRRLLAIETDIDLTLLELDNLMQPEVTIPLTSGMNPQQVTPAGVVAYGFDPAHPSDPPRVALRASNNTNVFTWLLGPSSDPNQEYTPVPNVIDVGGVPSDIAFVRTGDGGLRIAALVPTKTNAVLADPDTSITTPVALPAPYSKLSLVTDVLGGGTGTDVAMMWNSGSAAASGVAFWLLGNTVGQPYFSIQAVPVSQPIQAVDDVAHFDHLKVLETQNSSGFYVLNLRSRTASPLETNTRAQLVIAPDGGRLWAFTQGGQDLAKVDFASLTPVNVKTDTPIDAAFDVARSTSGRSLIAVHKVGGVGVTVFDADNPDTATSRHVPGLLLEGP